MREILFRGKRVDNGDWVEGYLYVTNGGEYEISSYNPKIEMERWTYIVDPSTVGQYTGLKDKNGKRIFEGDIVNFNRTNALGYINKRIGEVKYYDKFPVFYIFATTGDAWVWRDYSIIEVISNIHDHPELMEDSNE